jgi:hypothetical protein
MLNFPPIPPKKPKLYSRQFLEGNLVDLVILNETFLFINKAPSNGNLDAIKMMIEKEADKETKDSVGSNPLICGDFISVAIILIN